MLKLWFMFLTLTVLRLLLMPVLSFATWLLGNPKASAHVAYTWEMLCAIQPPWIIAEQHRDAKNDSESGD